MKRKARNHDVFINFIVSSIFILSFIFSFFQCTSPSFAQAQQSLGLKAGFNFISFTINPSSKPAELIQSFGGPSEDIYLYSASAGGFLSASEGTLASLGAGKGYIFKMKSDCTVNVAGTTVSALGAISLKAGFNLIGFSKIPKGIVFSELMKKFPFILGMYKWNSASGSFIQLVRNNNSIEALDGTDPSVAAGQAYFINLAGDTTLDLDGLAISFGGGQTLPAVPGAALSFDIGGGVKLDMVYIPAGTFLMGSPTEEGSADETPQRTIRITRGFYMAKYETTQAQWQAITGNNPSAFAGDLSRPVEKVSWNDICGQNGFLDKLNRKGLGVFRLPTEAEWEYACRAGSKTTFYWGDTFDGGYCWYSGIFASDGNSGQVTHPVGQKKPNSFGLYDMCGNVMEWCSDWYDKYSATSNTDDPIGPPIGAGVDSSGSLIPCTHVIRGGSAISNANDCRSAYRYCYLAPSDGFKHTGFRLVMPADAATYYLDKTSDSIIAGSVYSLAGISMTATFPNGVSQNLTPSWTIVSGGGSISGTGYTAPAAPGKAVLQAVCTISGVPRTAVFTLNILSDVASVTITGGSAVAAGKTLQLSAAAKNAAGNLIPGKIASWLSLTPEKAAVDSNGLVTGVKAGAAVIRASIDGKTADITISVTGASFLPDKVIELGGGVKLEMVYIPAGTFTMGTPENEPGRGSTGYEGPQHKVTITRGFYIGKYELTQSQWKAITGDGSDFFSVPGDNFPAVIGRLSPITGAGGFIEKLNRKSLGSFSLPTEAQWEYACRAGSTTAYYWGDAMNGDYCLYEANNTSEDLSVGKKLPNAWGLYDMSGGVWEWCYDALERYTPDPAVDPSGPDQSAGSYSDSRHVIRGGGRYSTPEPCRSGARNFMDGGGFPYSSTGFRLIMAEPDGEKTLLAIRLSAETASISVNQTFDLSQISASLQYSGEALGAPHPVSPVWSIKSGGGTIAGLSFTAPASPATSILQASYTSGGKTVNSDFVITIENSSLKATIGPEGGTIAGNGIKITIPQSALAVSTELNISSAADQSGYLSENTAGGVYRISGLSEILNSTISVELELTDSSKISKGCSVYVSNPALNKGMFYKAKFVQNKITVDIDDIKSLFNASFINMAPERNGISSSPSYEPDIPWVEIRPVNYITELSPSARFEMQYPPNYVYLNDVITNLEASYAFIENDLGLSWKALDKNPIKVALVPMGSSDESDEASYTDAFRLKNGVIRINTQLFNPASVRSLAAIRHEMFHFMQAVHDSRIVRGSDWWDWMSEATAVCVEREMLRLQGAVPDIIDKYAASFFSACHGLDYPLTNTDITRAQHGYAASIFFSYLIEKRSVLPTIVSNIYITHRDYPNLSPLEALSRFVGGNQTLAALWCDFCIAYLTENAYSGIARPAFQTIVNDCINRNLYSILNFSQAATPRESFFEIPSGSYPLSAHLKEIYFEPISSTTWDFPADTTNIILELQTNSDNLNIRVFDVRTTPVNKAHDTPVYLPQFNVGRNGKVTIPNVIQYAKNSRSLILMAVNSETDPSFKTVSFSLKITKEIIRSDKTIDLGGGTKLEMMYIPAGTFTMGSASTGDGPQHQVKISKGFYMGKYELTIAQWQAVMGTGDGSLVGYFSSDLPDYPAYNTCWNDICNPGGFLEKINLKNLGKFRLPTEAEWEYACRAGTTADRYWGAANIDDYCWYFGNSGAILKPDGIGSKLGLQSVGKKRPNGFRLYDMNGNVEEWCSDWFGAYTADAAVDPKGPATGTAHVIRGGDWYYGTNKCSSTYRNSDAPGEWYTFRGFRLVMEE